MFYKLTGLISIIGPLIFILVAGVLGCVQTNYSHLHHTVSMSANGQYGWIQELNFVIIGSSLTALGLGLGKSFYQRKLNPISLMFFALALGVLSLAIFPTSLTPGVTDYTLNVIGVLHFAISLAIIIGAAVVIVFMINLFTKNKYWENIIGLTKAILVFNVVTTVIWLIPMVLVGLAYPFKGLIQKVLIGNVLIWMIVMGWKLYKMDMKDQSMV